MTAYATDRQLFRSRDDAFVGGVCAGLADYFELDSIVVRILAVLLAVLTFGLAAIVYVVLWVRIPLAPEAFVPYDVRPESAESTAFGCVDCAFEDDSARTRIPLLARLAVAAGLMMLFLAVAMTLAPRMPGTQWWQFWPLGLLMCGLCLIIIPVRSRFEALWHSAGIVTTSLGASILPMSLGMMSWNTIPCTFERFWPILVVAAVLFVLGLRRSNAALVIGAAFCLVVFCLAGLSQCGIPGEIETLLFYAPNGQSLRISIVG